MPYDGNMISILDFCWSDLQPVLEHPAGRLFVLIEGMGIDVQRGGGRVAMLLIFVGKQRGRRREIIAYGEAKRYTERWIGHA